MLSNAEEYCSCLIINFPLQTKQLHLYVKSWCTNFDHKGWLPAGWPKSSNVMALPEILFRPRGLS